jgi:hypothetical protein
MNKSKGIARGGLYTALSLLCVYISTLIPTSKLYVLGIASCIIIISVLTIGIKYSIIVYAATSILSIFLLGAKWNVWAYIILFGSYGFVKYDIEKLNTLVLEIILKLAFFNVCVIAIYYLFILFLGSAPAFKIPLGFAFVMLQPIFLICDYAVTLFISYMRRHYLKNI